MIATVPCQISRVARFDVMGQEEFALSIPAKCAVVKLESGNDLTTVRADSSASRAHAREFIADAVLLFAPLYALSIDDRVEIHGIKLRVKKIRARFAITGRLDHNQVECEIWA